MDFKVAGTQNGITAIQMDIKVQGITLEIMREAMEQARKSRYFIIDKLAETIAAPRDRAFAVRAADDRLKIDPAKIKDVIGPGGKVINKIIADTGVEKIDIEDDGSVFITSLDGASGDKAKTIVENLTKEILAGDTYTGTVTRIIPIGAFVQILPGQRRSGAHQPAGAQARREGRRRRQSRRRDHGQGHRDRLPGTPQPVA